MVTTYSSLGDRRARTIMAIDLPYAGSQAADFSLLMLGVNALCTALD